MNKSLGKKRIKFEVRWEKLGEQVKYYRLGRDLLQKDLAEMVGTTVNTISRLEIGAIGCSLEMLLSLCEALQVSPDALLSGNYNMLYSPYYEHFCEMKGVIQEHLTASLQEFFENLPEKKKEREAEEQPPCS